MMIKVNSRESIEIVENVFVNRINEEGGKYLSWDELSEAQQQCYTRMCEEIKAVYAKYKDCAH